MQPTGESLPSGVEIAWGLRTRPTRGPAPALGVEGIVDAAVGIAADEGLAAVSMGRVAKQLGAGTMSLYRHVRSKDDLFLLMADAVFRAPPPEAAAGEQWRDGLDRWARRLFEVLVANSWVLRIPISGPPTTPHQLAWMESALATMRATRLAADQKLSIVLVIIGHVRSEVTISVETSAATIAGSGPGHEGMQAYRRLVTRLVSPEKFPELCAVFADEAVDGDDDAGRQLDFGLTCIFDGIEQLVRHARGELRDR